MDVYIALIVDWALGLATVRFGTGGYDDRLHPGMVAPRGGVCFTEQCWGHVLTKRHDATVQTILTADALHGAPAGQAQRLSRRRETVGASLGLA